MKGWCIMPNTGSPKRISPISVPQAGMPEMKDLVPSIGSSTQTYSASVRSAPYSSPRMPWSGKARRMRARMACSAARSAAVTGSKPPACLFSTASAVRKNGRMVSPETLASWSTKLAKSMTVMGRPPAFHSTYRRPGAPATGVSSHGRNWGAGCKSCRSRRGGASIRPWFVLLSQRLTRKRMGRLANAVASHALSHGKSPVHP